MSVKRNEKYALIERVRCPRCGAERGKPCRRSSGTVADMPHGARRDAAIKRGKYMPA